MLGSNRDSEAKSLEERSGEVFLKMATKTTFSGSTKIVCPKLCVETLVDPILIDLWKRWV